MFRIVPLCLAAALLFPATAAPATLTLAEALEQVRERDPRLASRRAMVTAARLRARRAGAWDPPMLEAGLTNVPSNGRLDMDPMTMRMVGAAQRLPLSGSRGLARRSGEAAAEAEVRMLEREGYARAGAAIEAYVSALEAAGREHAAAGHEMMMHQLVAAARSRLETARGGLDDVLRAQSEAARVRQDAAAFAAERETARARLDALRDAGPGGFVDSLAPAPEWRLPEDDASWRALIGSGHPERSAADARVREARFGAAAARRMVWPDLEIRASYGARGRLMDGTDLDDMFSVTAAVMVPLFAGSRELAEAREMDAMAGANEAEARAVALDLEARLAAIRAEVVRSRRTLALLADTVLVLQRRALDVSLAAFRNGTLDLLRVLDAAHALYREELALSDARESLGRAIARAIALTGRTDAFGLGPALDRSEP